MSTSGLNTSEKLKLDGSHNVDTLPVDGSHNVDKLSVDGSHTTDKLSMDGSHNVDKLSVDGSHTTDKLSMDGSHYDAVDSEILPIPEITVSEQTNSQVKVDAQESVGDGNNPTSLSEMVIHPENGSYDNRAFSRMSADSIERMSIDSVDSVVFDENDNYPSKANSGVWPIPRDIERNNSKQAVVSFVINTEEEQFQKKANRKYNFG